MEERHKAALRNAMNAINDSDIIDDVLELYLYGSVARGKFHYSSDVDLFLVLREGSERKNAAKIRELVSELNEGIDTVEIDLHVAYGMAWKASRMLYYTLIRREGIRLW